MKWATRKNMKSDRAACYWLIKTQIDPEAQFMFVDEQEIENLTAQGVLTFDARDAKYKHKEDLIWGKFGDSCSFQALMEEFDLNGKDGALDYMAGIIYASDIGHKRGDYSPREGYGIWAMLQGLSIVEEDDVQKCDFILQFFDALYAYCQEKVNEEKENQ